ncbi:hypothetical protein [Nodosilinea sp. E11]|uniref:hypothetical protein n=1 Tax=Nodosilinea sp. E11 TaxID=3037479 RepID=UPI0029350C36|nr:hypothetical protein [Nodosilinea sp. E11]WOD38992.1 hypothetical protein RRF56_22560 [Nodosilinea sp. E11]
MATMRHVGNIGMGLLLGIALTGSMGLANTQAKSLEGISTDSVSDIRLKQNRAQTYRNAMLAGYSATERKDYHTALINFRRALAARPGDRYATAAIRNMEAYIARERAEAAKQAEIVQRQETLAAAVAASDWACAAASVDRLVVLIPPDSADRSRLIAYRGELTGFIQARANLDQWSTVCPGGQV